jgi:4-carboxymuconolactone decarboxylase
MSRLPPIDVDQLQPDDRRRYDIIAGSRSGGLGGPFSVLFRAPVLGEAANAMHNAFRLHGKLDRRLFEMLILMVSNEYHAKYVWTFHVAKALQAGLAGTTIEAIRDGRRPDFAIADEPIIYDLVRELMNDKTLSDGSYKAGLEALGLELLIEVVTATGFYSTISMVVNSFDVPEPGKAS